MTACRFGVLCVVLVFMSCGAPVGGSDASTDAAVEDEDAGVVEDGGTGDDAGVEVDAGLPDAGTVDSGAPDAGAPDAGPVDAGQMDAGQVDAGPLAPSPGPGDLVIVELQGNPQGANDDQAEYIELLNVSGRALDLQGVKLRHVDWSGGEPVNSLGQHTIAGSVPVAAGARVLLARSSGGYFGGATRDYVYAGFVFSNGTNFSNRLRLLVPSWNGSEPPQAADVIDEVKTAPGAFDNPLRGRALQLDPSKVASPDVLSNDSPANWCHAQSVVALEYFATNWGTPRAVNVCQ